MISLVLFFRKPGVTPVAAKKMFQATKIIIVPLGGNCDFPWLPLTAKAIVVSSRANLQ
jgi:hypothetical protein